MHDVKVFRGKHTHRGDLFGPLPGRRHGNVVAYEFELPKTFEPWPGRSRLERTFVLLDLGVSIANPCWRRWHRPDGRIGTNEPEGRDSWYVDLISVESAADNYTFLDLYVDAVVTFDDRGYRVLDLNELADAMESGDLSSSEVCDGLRRWQAFLDGHLHGPAWEPGQWHDFPPKCISELQDLEAPLGEVVTAPE